MAKTAARRARDGDPCFDDFAAKDFDWLDGRARPAAAAIHQIEAALLPAVSLARDLFRAIGAITPACRPCPNVDLRGLSPLLARVARLAGHRRRGAERAVRRVRRVDRHVIGCFGKLIRGEGVSRVDALKADAWLRDVPGETLLFG